MKKAIGMLVMLMGLTTNAQSQSLNARVDTTQNGSLTVELDNKMYWLNTKTNALSIYNLDDAGNTALLSSRYELGENLKDDYVNQLTQSNQPKDSLEFVKAYEFLTNGQITNAKVENGKVKCEKIDYSDACLQTSVNLENSTLTITNTLNGDKFVYSLKVESALLHNNYGACEYDTNSLFK